MSHQIKPSSSPFRRIRLCPWAKKKGSRQQCPEEQKLREDGHLKNIFWRAVAEGKPRNLYRNLEEKWSRGGQNVPRCRGRKPFSAFLWCPSVSAVMSQGTNSLTLPLAQREHDTSTINLLFARRVQLAMRPCPRVSMQVLSEYDSPPPRHAGSFGSQASSASAAL